MEKLLSKEQRAGFEKTLLEAIGYQPARVACHALLAHLDCIESSLSADQARIKALEEYIEEYRDLPCIYEGDPDPAYAPGHGEVSCYTKCGPCRMRQGALEILTPLKAGGV